MSVELKTLIITVIKYIPIYLFLILFHECNLMKIYIHNKY